MADKKRGRKTKKLSNSSTASLAQETYDESLERIMQETISAVVEKEIYPQGRKQDTAEDDTQIYYTPMERYKKTGRYSEDPYTVAQHMQDRTQFRH